MAIIIGTLKNLVALSLIGAMVYGGYLLMNLKPPRTKGLSFVGGNYLANEPAKELISRDCGKFVWDEDKPKLLFYSWIFGSSSKKSKPIPKPKKNEMGKIKTEWEECIKEIPSKRVSKI